MTVNGDSILCKCGHSLHAHSAGAGQCYQSTRRTERRKDYTGKYHRLKCLYCCYCKKFETLAEDDLKEGEVKG